jgi:hypothetical protein
MEKSKANVSKKKQKQSFSTLAQSPLLSYSLNNLFVKVGRAKTPRLRENTVLK